MTISEAKRAMRTATKSRILALGREERGRQEAAIFELFQNLPGLSEARTILLYASHFSEEFSTFPMMDLVLRNGQRLVCPRVHRETKRLDLFVISQPHSDFESGDRGLREPSASLPRVLPSAIDWALVPGIAFDASGFRLGRGGGHYDRLLPTLTPDCPRWSLAFDEQWVPIVPVESHDVRLTGIRSPGRASVHDANQ